MCGYDPVKIPVGALSSLGSMREPMKVAISSTLDTDNMGVPMTLPMRYPFAANSMQICPPPKLGDAQRKQARAFEQANFGKGAFAEGISFDHEVVNDDVSTTDASTSEEISTTDETVSSSPKLLIENPLDDGLEDCALEECQPCNPGSLGHPDFCARPCLYFAEGTCQNGDACGFCHLDHRKGMVHLDKRNRQILGKLAFKDRAKYILPIVADRAQDLGLTQSLKATKDFQNVVSELPEAAQQVKVSSRESKKLRHLLKCLKVQELFKWLKSADASPSVHISLEVLACQVQQEGSQRTSLGDAAE
jgi:hypothetical protein